MSFYQALREGTVRNALRKYGFIVVFTRNESEGYTPGQPEVVEQTTIEGVGILDGYRKDEIDGQVVQRGDARIWYEGDQPKIGDVLTLDDAEWRIVNTDQIKPGGETVLWELQVRK